MNFLLLESKIGGFIADLFSVKFTLFDMSINIGNLAGSVEKMMGLGFSQSGDYATLWNLGTNLFNIFVPVATSLLTLFFLMDLFGLLREINQVSWERVVMKGIKFWAVYAVIVNLPYLLKTIIAIINDIYEQKGSLKVNNSAEVKSLTKAIQDLRNGNDVFYVRSVYWNCCSGYSRLFTKIYKNYSFIWNITYSSLYVNLFCNSTSRETVFPKFSCRFNTSIIGCCTNPSI